MQGVAADIIDALAKVRGCPWDIVYRMVKRHTRCRHDDGGIAVGKIHQRVGVNGWQQGVESGGIFLRVIAQQQFFQVMGVPVAVAGGAAGEGEPFGGSAYLGQPSVQCGVFGCIE